MSAPLAGLNVIEFAGLGPAPLAGQLLGDQGAQVIVIDRASGQTFDKEPNRRAKRSIALNLKHEQGIGLANILVSKADVLIEGFRPGVMERLGLGPDECMELNPRLIYARMTGWGQEGPLASTAGHDLNYLATTGALHAMGKAGEPPMPPLNLVADYGGGTMFLLFGILSAIYEREKSGMGQVVDGAMVDGVIAMMGLVHGQIGQGVWENKRQSNWLDGAAPFYRCYECNDGKFLSVGCIEPQFFAEFVNLAGLPEDFINQQMDKKAWPQMSAYIAGYLKSKSRDEWAGIFEGSDACVSPVLNFEEAARYQHNVARGNFVEINHVTQSAPAPRFSRSNGGVSSGPVVSGSDCDSILKEVGLESDEVARLKEVGAIT
ncbi:MAG: CoA transferase [Rhizobiaceae bacterium]|nr:CoA transferase [Rhizobiaceae bacterium]